MEAIKSPNSAQPSALDSPVPGNELALAAQEFMKSQKPVQLPDAQAQAAQDFMAQQNAVVEEEAPTELSPEQIMPEPGFVQANLEQFSNIGDRIRAGLGANEEEKAGFLRKKYGDENVNVSKEGKIRFRRGPGEKFKSFDPEAFELAADIADFSRELVTEAAMVPGELMGATVGSALPGAGTAAGAVAGRVGSVPLANKMADGAAELAGVPQDPTRNVYAENAVGMGLEAILPAVGRQIAKKIPGTAMYKAAKEAGEKEIVALTKQNKEVVQAASDLANEGRAAYLKGDDIGVPGADVNMMGHHLNPDDPRFKALADVAASNPKFINAQNQLAEGWGESAKNVLNEIALRNGRGPVNPEQLSSKIIDAAADTRKAEGQAIGKFKAKAMAKLGNAKQPLPPQVNQQLDMMLQALNFKQKVSKVETFNRTTGKRSVVDKLSYVPPNDLRPLVGQFGTTTMGQVRSLVNTLGDLKAKSKEGIRLSDLEASRNVVGSLSDSLYGTQAGAEMGKLSGGLREHYRGVIGSGLSDDFEKKAFNQSMDDHGFIMDNLRTLKSVLKDNASLKAVVSSVFTGKENINKIKAIKSVAPEQYPALKEEFINQMLEKYGSRETKTGLKSGAMLNAMEKQYGRQFMEEVLNDGPGANYDTLRKVLLVTERMENQYRGAKVDQMPEQVKQGAMNTMIGLVGDIKFKAINGISALLKGSKGQEHILTQIMTRDGIDRYIANYPGKIDKAAVSKNMKDLLAHQRVISKFKSLPGEVAENAAIQRGAKRVIIQERTKSGNIDAVPTQMGEQE